MIEIIDIRNFVNVNVRSTPTLLSETNPNNLLLITTEKPSNIDISRNYLNARQVGLDYGTNSETFALASSIFAQSPNILTGKGKLIIAPFIDAVSATRGKFVSANLTANLNDLKAVGDGDLTITLNGTAYTYTNIDFTDCISISDIATILSRLNKNITITEASGVITFESKKVGSTSAVALSDPDGSGTDLTGAGLLNIVGGVISNALIEDAVAITTATAVEATDKIWFNVWSDTNDLNGTISTIKASSDRTIALFYSRVVDAPKFLGAYPATLCSVNFSGNNTFLNANVYLRSLATLSADPLLGQAEFDIAKNVGANIYTNNAGLAGVVNSKYGSTGKFADQVYGRQALTYSLATGDFNALRSGGIQQTPQGMDKLLSATNAVFARYVRAGYIGVGLNWNSPISFGNEEDLKNSIFSVGYYIFADSISDQAQNEREERDAPLQQCAYKEAGFIYRASVDVLVEA